MTSEVANFEAVMGVLDAWANPNGIPIAVPQQPIENAQTYIRVHMLNSRSVNVGMGGGPSVLNRYPGILQISVFTPLGEGEFAGLSLARELIDLLENAVLAGMEFSGGGILLAGEDEGHMRHDAEIDYFWDKLTAVRKL